MGIREIRKRTKEESFFGEMERKGFWEEIPLVWTHVSYPALGKAIKMEFIVDQLHSFSALVVDEFVVAAEFVGDASSGPIPAVAELLVGLLVERMRVVRIRKRDFEHF